MSAPSTQQLLDDCKTAIAKVLGGVQEYTQPDGSTARYPSLKELMATKDALMEQLAVESNQASYLPIEGGFGGDR